MSFGRSLNSPQIMMILGEGEKYPESQSKHFIKELKKFPIQDGRLNI